MLTSSMDDLRPCRTWDRVLWLDGLAVEAMSRPDEPDEVRRCRRRIDAPEQALQTVRNDQFIALFGFRDDVEHRRARWAHLHPVTRPTPRIRMKRVLIGLGAALLATGVLFAFAPILSFFGLFVILPFVMTDDVPRQARDRLNIGSCPDCGYSLVGVRPGIPIERAGLDAGPRACPECGCAWPLVPPPA